jgi:2-polyprenyl-3-methyl-5-hydroxy-6-metoxy-1,4-benzoquinol methylase
MSQYEEKITGYFSNIRSEIFDIIPKYSNRVLEIGCGTGHTLESLKEKKLCSETIGIELFASAAEEAKKRVDIVYCVDVEKEGVPVEIGAVDLILLLDVLEHLVDPWSFLTNLVATHLSPRGVVVASIPNARHFSLVLPLLGGNFDYVERGILDRTHLRFFTRRSAEKLLENAGLEITQTRSTSLGIHLNSGKFNIVTLGLFSEFLSLQYLFKATVSGVD